MLRCYSYDVTLWQCYDIKMLRYYAVTMLRSYDVTMLRSRVDFLYVPNETRPFFVIIKTRYNTEPKAAVIPLT